MDKNLNYRLNLKDFFKKTMMGAVSQTKTLDNSMSKLDRTIRGAQNVLTGGLIGTGIVAGISSVVDSLKNYEYFSASLRTLMHGDRQAAKSLEGQLVNLAAKTPFSLVDVQAGSKQLLAYGFAAGNIVKDMKMLGDVSSGVGAPLNDIIYLYGTLKTQGRAYTRDIMQFTSRGIPIIRELAKQFGVSESKIKDLVESGKVGFPEIEKAFKSMTTAGGTFFSMMDEQSKTVGGRLSNLGDAWEQLKVSIGKSQTGIVASTVDFANTFVSKLGFVVEKLNQMDDAFARSGKDLSYSIMERFNNWLFMGSTGGFANMFTGGKGRMDMLQRSLESMYVTPSSRNEVEAFRSKKQLAQFASNYIGSYQKKEISRLEYDRGMSLIKYAQGMIEGNIKLFASKTEKANLGGGKEATTGIGSPTEISAGRPQNINIHVEKLGVIEVENMTADGMKEAAQRVKPEWSKELLELLNDANLMARR